jgi:hypothetical protein
MPRFEIRPTSVDAERVPTFGATDDAWERLFAWLSRSRQWSVEPHGIDISTAWGVRVAYPGDWIVRDDAGALSVYTAPAFDETFARAGQMAHMEDR